ncbi:MAG: hypothetical protein IJB96_04280 [Lachnospira sp.]|nr:hypothetical protein [Lachnospira sp.]
MFEVKRLYDSLPYETEFEAEVLACEPDSDKEGICIVVLNQTLFFPEEGGQSPDKGMINGCEVLDVQIKDGVIYHALSGELAVGSRVEGRIDWTHRFNNMQQHSGEHIFSGLVNKHFGYDNVGFHLSDQTVTMDFNGVLSEEDVTMIELEVNRVIVKNVPIVATFPTKEELEKLEYRSKKEINEQMRIVTIEGVDVCACCAPHVRTTGEIGMLKVVGCQNYKGGVRISILCGFRALEDYKSKTAIVAGLVAGLSEKPENVITAVDKLKEVNYNLKTELNKKTAELMAVKMSALSADGDDVLVFEAELDDNATRNTVNSLMEQYSGVCAVFVGNDEAGYRFIMGSKSKNCREVLAKLKEKLTIRGGGTEVMVQGMVTGTEDAIRKSFDGGLI